jgi:hypothetical protein
MASGKVHTMDIPCTDVELARFKQGALVQDAFPSLTPDQREFILTGITPEEWNELFKEGE